MVKIPCITDILPVGNLPQTAAISTPVVAKIGKPVRLFKIEVTAYKVIRFTALLIMPGYVVLFSFQFFGHY